MVKQDEIWLSIDTNDMMRDSMNSFIKFLNDFKVNYRSYSSESGNKIYMEIKLNKNMIFNKDHDFHKGMGEWVYYYRINYLKNKPNVSDYNILEDMSVDPYGW